MTTGELLELGDPLLPHVLEVAHRCRDAHEWVLESARRWARCEFVRRWRAGVVGEWERQRLCDEMHRLQFHQVAVLADPISSSAGCGVQVGFLGECCHDEYVKLWQPNGYAVAGVMRVLDVIELPAAYRVRAWPWPVGA